MSVSILGKRGFQITSGGMPCGLAILWIVYNRLIIEQLATSVLYCWYLFVVIPQVCFFISFLSVALFYNSSSECITFIKLILLRHVKVLYQEITDYIPIFSSFLCNEDVLL